MDIYGLSPRDKQRLEAVLRWFESGNGDSKVTVTRNRAVPKKNYTCIVKVGSGGITAEAGGTPGSGTGTICKISGGTITELDLEEITVYNIGEGIEEDRYITVQRDLSGFWVATACGSSQGT